MPTAANKATKGDRSSSSKKTDAYANRSRANINAPPTHKQAAEILPQAAAAAAASSSKQQPAAASRGNPPAATPAAAAAAAAQEEEG